MLNPSSFISASASAPPLPPAAARATPSSAPAADTVVTISDGDIVHHLAVDMPAEIGEADAAPEIKGILGAFQTDGFAQRLNERLAPLMEPGSASRKIIDSAGVFNVNQIAIEFPLGVLGVSGKYGVQMNIVKPDIVSTNGNYYLQLFPFHDEIGFDVPQALSSLLPYDILPEWCGLSAQIIRNHGLNIPFVHTDRGWTCDKTCNSVEYLEEWVIRPLELDLKYFGVPVQATIGLELGVHFKWSLGNPKWRIAFATNMLANIVGFFPGLAATRITGADSWPVMMHGGAMLFQLATHGLQCCCNALCPDEILTWAGVTLSAADINLPLSSDFINRLTQYPRIWSHVHDGCWHLKEQAEAAVAPIIRRAENIRATEMAEMGIDNSLFPSDTPLSTVRQRIAAPISERYEAQQF